MRVRFDGRGVLRGLMGSHLAGDRAVRLVAARGSRSGLLEGLVPVALVVIGLLGSPCLLAAQQVERVSLGDRAQGNGESSAPVLSSNGRVVAFSSAADNLVPGDSNGVSDVFVRDVKTGSTTRVSTGVDGAQGNGFSVEPAISANGRFIAFLSNADNLVPEDTNQANDIFVHDRKKGITTRVSVSTSGGHGNDHCFDLAISANGNVVAFTSRSSNLADGDTNFLCDVFVHSRKTGVTVLASVGPDGVHEDQPSDQPSLSSNGRYVAFFSDAANLTQEEADGPFLPAGDVYVRDMKTGETLRVSGGIDGAQADNKSYEPVISSNGRFVAFRSDATNIVAGDTNGVSDVFVRDMKAGLTTRVSVATDGAQGNSTSSAPTLSSNGRVVAFASGATNLVEGDTNATLDVFLHDLKLQETVRVSLGADSAEGDQFSLGPALTPNARFVAFWSPATNFVAADSNAQSDVFVRDLKAETTARASVTGPDAQSDGGSDEPVFTSNGRCVVFESSATNLVPGDTNASSDIFMRRLKDGRVTKLSVGFDGAPASNGSLSPLLSKSGRYVAFSSLASNLVPDDTNGATDVFVLDLKSGQTTRVSLGPEGIEGDDSSSGIALSSNGRVIAFRSFAGNLVPGDTNAVSDIFVHDTKKGETTRVSVSTEGAQADGASSAPAISSNGRFVAFSSSATNLVAGDTNGATDVFLHDRKTGVTTRVSLGADDAQGDGPSFAPALSSNGNVVAFRSGAANLVPDDTNGLNDAFVRDLKLGLTQRVSVGTDGAQGNGTSFEPAISSNGRAVVFESDATNLVPGDTNGFSDIFVRDLETGVTTRVSMDAEGAQANNDSDHPTFSPNGRTVGFSSEASNLVAGDTNAESDAFMRELD